MPKLNVFIILMSLTIASCSVNQQIRKADKRYEIGEYYKASNLYRKAYGRVNVSKERQKKAYTAFRAGDCFRLINDNDKAERYLAYALKHNLKDSIAILYYADILRKNKKAAQSIEIYDAYLRKAPTDRRAIDGRQSALEQAEWEKNPTKYKVARIEALVSKRSERNPSFPGGDGDIIYFATTRENKEVGGKNSNITGVRNGDIFVAKKNSLGQWDKPEPMEGDINTIDDEGSPSFSEDGKMMYFTRCRYVKGESHGAEICSSTRAGGKWGKAKEVSISKDSSLTFAHPAVSPDGKFIYYVSDFPGGFGGKDIWRSSIEGDKIGTPVNLGPTINSAGDEMYPYVREDGTLYFSSNGHPGFGGLDIFYATEDADGKWEIHNMMYPVNSNSDDFGISFIKGKEAGAFSSNRGERKGYDKIWEFELPPVVFDITGKVLSTTGEPLADATVRIVGDDGTNTKVKTKKDGSYSFPLKKDVKYVMLGNCRGYLNQKNEVETMGLEDSKNFPVNFSLASVSKPVGLDNIFFEFGKATLTPQSSTALDKLVKLLNDNPNITIEIGAHTDKVGSAEGNLTLSGKRAQSVVDYLIKGGIEADRLTAKGYGKTQPITVDKAFAKKYSFAKEGDVLDEEFIDKLTPEQQEIANQANRRTEFRVLKTTYKMY